MNLEGKTVLVTGASKGIGQGIAIRLAQDGADVAINYRSDPEGAKATLAEVEKAGRKGCTIQADMGKMESIPKSVPPRTMSPTRPWSVTKCRMLLRPVMTNIRPKAYKTAEVWVRTSLSAIA